jgi:hypothetical protein
MKCDVIFTIFFCLIAFVTQAQLSDSQILTALEGLDPEQQKEVLGIILDSKEANASDIIIQHFQGLSPETQSNVVGAIMSRTSISVEVMTDEPLSKEPHVREVAFETPSERPTIEPMEEAVPEIDVVITASHESEESTPSSSIESEELLVEAPPTAPEEFNEKGKEQEAEITEEDFKFAKAEWDDMLYDLGEVVQGQTATHTFTVTNKGLIPLELTDAKASCGCTIPEYSNDPILPGETGQVTVVFDSSKKLGKFHQGIVVYNNTINRRSIIYVRGTVIKPGQPFTDAESSSFGEEEEKEEGK